MPTTVNKQETLGPGGGGVSHTDEAAFTTGADQMVPVGGIYDETAPASLAEDQAGAVRLTVNRAMHTVIRDGAGNERSATVGADLGLDGDTLVITEASYTTLINAIRLDDAPTYYYSAAMDVTGWGAVWVFIFIDSTLAPTNVRILAQFSDDAGTTWWDFEEGFWAALYWEDVDTAAGIRKALLLPVAGIDTLRIGAIGTGTDATNFFDVTVKARAVRGNIPVAHA